MSNDRFIPFNQPGFVGGEQTYMADAIQSGHASGNGPYTKKCQALLEQELGVSKVLLTTSCTDALEMSALLLNVERGDEVIIPSFTFVSTVNAFVLRGARPVFSDIRPDTLNMDEALLDRLITPRTKAIVPVHYAGVGCEMDAITKIAARHNIAVVEDNAHGLFAKYRSKYLGTFGGMATQSFHETKNFTCGEGGALLINDPQYIERAEIIWEKGTDRSRFFRGQVDKYTWVDVGSSFLPSDLLAAYLFAQLEAKERVQAARKAVFDYYMHSLSDWAAAHKVQLPILPAWCEQPYHMFYMVLPSAIFRQALIKHLRDQSIQSVFHYLPLHIAPMGRKYGYGPGDCPVTEQISERLVRLPFYNDLASTDQARVVAAIRSFAW
jgi:dTDP-4-amino-4,6-dideoxygalactose transaminase